MKLLKMSLLAVSALGLMGAAHALDIAGIDTAKGEATYKKACFACHDAGVAGSPKLGDKAVWEPRLAQGMDKLLETVKKGKNAMPPKGTCAACTDDDFKQVIAYMASKVK